MRFAVGFALALVFCAVAVSAVDVEELNQGPPDTLKSLEDAIAKLEKADKAFPDIVFSNGHLVNRGPPLPSFPAFPNPGSPPRTFPAANQFHLPPPPPFMAAKLAAQAAQQAAAKRLKTAEHGENGEVAKAQVHQGEDCTFELDGARYDLNPLRLSVGQAEYVTQDSSRMIYKMNLCGVATTPASDCQRSNGMICQYDQGPAPILEVIARWNAAPYPIWSYIDENYKDAGVKLSFRNGDDCSFRGMKKTREAVVNFACDKEVGKMGPVSIQEVSTCNYVVTVPTSLSCWDAAQTTSFGWYFIFFLLLASALYLGIGIAYNRSKHQKAGMEAIPNLEFWKDLPGLVKDGIAFTWGKAMCYTCRQNKDGDDL